MAKEIRNKIVSENFLRREEFKEFQGSLKKEDQLRNRELQKRIKEKGFSAPIYIRHEHENYILDGHQRLKALNSLAKKGYTLIDDLVPVVYIEAETLEEAKESVLEYNSKYAEFDLPALTDWVIGLDLDGIDLGFEMPTMAGEEEYDESIEDDVPTVPEEPVVKYGDIFRLGNHYLMCGDTTNEKDLNELMSYEGGGNKPTANVKADLVRTDPPYNVNYTGHGVNTSNGIHNDNMDSEAFLAFLVDSFRNIIRIKKPKAGVYLWHNHKEQINFEKALLMSNMIVKQQLVRNKPSLGLGGGDYRPKHELCFYCSGKDDMNNFYGDRTHSTVVDLWKKDDEKILQMIKKRRKAETEGKTTIMSIKRDSVNEYVHPTQKPVELCQIALLNNTKKGDVVFDGFLGSGVAIISAEKHHRICYGMELDPRYAQVIIQRYYDVTKGTKEIECVNRDLDVMDFIKDNTYKIQE